MSYQLIHLSTYDRKDLYGTIDLKEFYLDMAYIKDRSPYTTVLLLHSFENLKIDHYSRFAIEAFRHVLETLNLKYYFLIDGTQEHSFINDRNIIPLSWGMFYSYYQLQYSKHPVVENYNPSSYKGLFLMGKAEKLHRIGVLKAFYESNKLDTIEWSFANPDHVVKQLHAEFFSEYSDDQYQDFLRTCVRRLDYDPEYILPDSCFAYMGFPFNHELYQTTGFSIISETWINDQNASIITEKTFRAITNKHPFVLLGSRAATEKLERMGLRTYNKYLKIPEYHELDEPQDKINAVLENAVHLKACLESPDWDLRNSMVEDTEYNFHRFCELAQNEINHILFTLQTDDSILKSIIDFHIQFQPFKRNG
jgi:hypothetical protein